VWAGRAIVHVTTRRADHQRHPYPADSVDPQASRRDPWPLAGVAGAAAFLLVAWAVTQSGAPAFDATTTTVIRGLPIPAAAWAAITAVGGWALVVGAVFAAAVLGAGRIRLALILAVILLGASLFVDQVKVFLERPRPAGEPLVPATGYSFPSGHTLNSTVAFGLAAVVVWRSPLRPVWRRIALVAGLAVPFLVGLSRIALGVHYPSDVLAGWLAGLAFVALGAVLVARAGAVDRDHWPGRRSVRSGR
jgi:undecaprenyl-diphosphatase